jgi:hypothetical protein
MPAISDKLLSKLRRSLATCCQAEFYTDQTLNTVFVGQNLNPYKNSLPQANNLQERIDFLIEFLSGAKQQGQLVLATFLEVLVERQPEGNDCRGILLELAHEIETELGAAADTLPDVSSSNPSSQSEIPKSLSSPNKSQGYSVMSTNNKNGSSGNNNNNSPNRKDGGLSINIEPGANFTSFGNIVSGHSNRATTTITGVVNNYNNANPQASSTKKERLAQLVAQLQAELAKAPATYRGETEEIAEQARKLLAEANQPKPNKTELKVRSQVFLEETNNLASVLPPVVGNIAVEIVELVGSLMP